jgi:hypothetical protein
LLDIITDSSSALAGLRLSATRVTRHSRGKVITNPDLVVTCLGPWRVRQVFGYPDFVRFSWSTTALLLQHNAHAFAW